MQNTKSIREQHDMNSREFRTLESDHKKSYFSQKQVNSVEDKSSFIDNLDKKANNAHIQIVKECD